MTDKRHCDNCDRVIKTGKGEDYYTLTRVHDYDTLAAVVRGPDTGTWHFCDEYCMNKYLEKNE